MSGRGYVYQRGVWAGTLERVEGVYRFTYAPSYLERDGALPVSFTLPLREEPYERSTLFPFFHGLLSEGSARELQLRRWKLDERDAFGLLLKTGRDAVGSVVVIEDDGGAPVPAHEARP